MTDVVGRPVPADDPVGDTNAGERARLGRRFVARVVDGWIVGGVGALAFGVSTRSPTMVSIGITSSPPSFAAASIILWFVISVLYETTFLMACGATPGKRFVGVEVVHATTSARPGFRHALVRAVCWPTALLIPFGILVFWATALADGRRRGIHDKLARTAPIVAFATTRAPLRAFLRIVAVWILVVAVCTPVQRSRPRFGHGQSTSGVTSEAAGTGTKLVAAAGGKDVGVEFTPTRSGPLRLRVTDVTVPASARFTVTGMDRRADGSITVRVRAERCGVSQLEQLVLHSRFGPLALQRTVALAAPIESHTC